jgi:hypothetical protein
MKGVNPLFGATARMKIQVDEKAKQGDEWINQKWNAFKGNMTFYARWGLIIAGAGVVISMLKK